MRKKTLLILILSLLFVLGPTMPNLVQAGVNPRELLETGNSDSYADLAIGAPGENNDAGAAHVLYANGSGVPDQAGDFWQQGSGGLPGTGEMWDYMGSALAAGDFNGDGYTDLAIGISHQSVGGHANAGMVQVLYATAAGLSSTNNQTFTQDDLFATAEPNDWFGQELAVGDFNADGYDDLAVGVPFEDVQVGSTNNLDAGAVAVIYGGASGLGSYNQVFDEYDLHGGGYETDDRFGYALAACDFNGDGYDDLAVGIPNEDFGLTDLGSVQIVFGTSDWLDTTDSDILFQGINGISSDVTDGENFGFSLAAGYFNGDNYCDLAVGVPGEERGTGYTNHGSVHLLYAGEDVFSPPESDWLWDRYDIDVAGEIQDDAYFGRVLASGDFNGDGLDDLAIGTPFDDVDSKTDAGSVNVMYGTTVGGLTDWGDRVWYQDGYFNTQPETNDRFG